MGSGSQAVPGHGPAPPPSPHRWDEGETSRGGHSRQGPPTQPQRYGERSLQRPSPPPDPSLGRSHLKRARAPVSELSPMVNHRSARVGLRDRPRPRQRLLLQSRCRHLRSPRPPALARRQFPRKPGPPVTSTSATRSGRERAATATAHRSCGGLGVRVAAFDASSLRAGL